jgi:1,4-dihydroxy-6-naphthoate synthase
MSGFKSMRVAIPGRHTTANLLMQLLCPQAKELVEMRYDHIAPAVQNGSVDAGLIIHETRFCLDKWGLISLCDVGQLWEEEYQSPVPLGCIVVDRSLSLEKRLAIADCIRRSLNYAWEQPEASQEYIAEHAQEIEADVRQAHISLYVNEESSQLSAAACAGIRTLLELAQKRAGRAFSMEEAILDPSTALRHPA